MSQIIVSISACIFCLGMWSWLHSFGTALVVYLLMAAFPRQCHVRRCMPICPHAVQVLSFIFCFAYMSGRLVFFGSCDARLYSLSHIYRQYTDYMGWSMDFTGPQMVLTLKLVSIAFCYHDGLPGSTPTDAQRKKALTTLPNLLEFYGY